jgi:ribosomal protein L37AE/L43A
MKGVESMIKKELKIPLRILKLQALLRRLPTNHKKRTQIEEEIGRRMAGYKGEQSLDYYLSFIRGSNHCILHDIRLPSREYHFQLDLLVLSPYYILHVDAKNISGTLYFDDTFNQLIRTVNGKEEGFRDPILQIKLQQRQFKEWLFQHKFPEIPIESLVVISNDFTIIKSSSKNPHYLRQVIHSSNLPFKIDEFTMKYRSIIYSEKELKRLVAMLVKKHKPDSSNILEQYSIVPTELLTGVQCPNCLALNIGRKKGSWHCHNCLHTSKDAHITALQDYLLLINSTITNSELRSFLNLPSRSSALKILKSLNLKSVGTYKGTSYYIQSDFL